MIYRKDGEKKTNLRFKIFAFIAKKQANGIHGKIFKFRDTVSSLISYMKKIVIKIGSRVLSKEDGSLNRKVIANLVRGVADLGKENYEVIIVSSGAVSSGRGAEILRGNFKVEAEGKDKKIVGDQILSSVGQPRLMSFYIEEFGKYELICAQGLVSRNDFSDRYKYLNLRTVSKNLTRLGIIPIFNENDFLSSEELRFSDNDQLACMVSAMIGADLLIILTDVPGVYDRDPKNKDAKIIPEIKNISKILEKISDDTGKLGRGGMKSKLMTAKLAGSLGIPMIIGSGFEKNIVQKLILEKKSLGTSFPVNKKRPNSLKSWIATGAKTESQILVSTYLADLLEKKKVASILISGIEGINGEFKKGDVVSVVSEKNDRELGRGQIRCDSQALIKEIEKFKNNFRKNHQSENGEKIIIHYNNFIFSD